ncbi:hypothetical protein HPL003_10100 [Paenibacillus terrae HPL-003]|uniref:Fibronectin type-III domain-containing protein n=1 Tax=Paenibacillus terrae (strain HPL-003) TaxID=985665 RepID=G7VV12_PAETH|nr:Ig-like domain-containing protein [Paenibacillus terrae]AET58781.1 hypothetical protein HPL003_10100 [Paenibacillus terrae HPL-003]
MIKGFARGLIVFLLAAIFSVQGIYAESSNQTVNELEILSIEPKTNESNVPINKIPIITFNQNIRTGNNIKDIKVTAGTNVVNATYSIHDSKLKIIPNDLLSDNMMYTIQIPKGALVYANNVSNEQSYSFSFKTISDLIPKMTSNTLPSGIANASSVYKIPNFKAEPYLAFDDINYADWSTSANVQTGWLSYTFPSPLVVNKYIIAASATTSHASQSALRQWTFEGFDEVSKKWVVLDTRNNISGWTASGKKSFSFVNKNAYATYRINVNKNNGFNQTTIGELQFLGYNAFAPENLIATGDKSQINLSWESATISKGYNVKRSLTPGGPYTTIATNIKTMTYTDTNVTNGTLYYYVVSAINDGNETNNSNEASATPQGELQPDPGTDNPSQPGPEPSEPTQPSGNRAILVITMTTGLEKEFDLSMKEVNDFIAWYEGKQAGTGSASYAINKHDNNKGAFSSRKDYMLYDRILTFEVSEYSK